MNMSVAVLEGMFELTLDDDSLNAVTGGGDDGGAPTQVVKVTTKESSTVTVSGEAAGGYKKFVGVSGQVTYVETTNSSSTSVPCGPVSDWKGVPYR